jgi:pyridoxamine 5'-phosphate oxidase
MQKYHEIRREYGKLGISEQDVLADPQQQFKKWFDEAIKVEQEDPTAMVLATVDDKNRPDTRVLLLKELREDGFIFYTNYQSIKAHQLAHNPYAALNFYWAKCARQVRVRGLIRKISAKDSEAYFATRPFTSQLAALASEQSQVIPNREFLEDKMQALSAQYQDKPVPCPSNWGGYILTPDEYEFFQGRDSRLHDRIAYQKAKGQWRIRRLSP